MVAARDNSRKPTTFLQLQVMLGDRTPETASTSMESPPSFNPFAVELPDKFDFRHPEAWKRWFVRWERYRVISGLHKQDADTQINTFLYAMGSEAEDVLISMRLTDEEAKDYSKLTASFERHFVPMRNVIYERARFNQRHQLEHEAVEEFVTELHRLAETCEFGSLKDDLIRDRLVVGLRDKKLSERLQLDSGLTLEKAVNTARNSEAVKGQQPTIRGGLAPSTLSTDSTGLDAVTSTQHPGQRELYGPARSSIDTIGQVEVDVTWNGQTIREQIFVIQSLRDALLGRPAIRALNVLPQILTVDECPLGDPVAFKYKDLFGPLGHMKAVYGIKLVPGATPHAVNHPRRVPIPLLPSVQAELRRMEDLGVIKKVDHPTEWCAPMVVAKKKDWKLRICVDYAELNKQIIRERLIMRMVEENLSSIRGAKLFSKLDANAGYWQAPLSPESSELTTFITPLGRYQFLRLPFGISTAPEFFQREMLRILEGLEGTVCHMDDILIYGNDEAEHD
ncbi:uncharacterized protein LOC135378816 [Ornithodoros turicata]|uniref:uncharacterized protein LOC135378816 n=1 Tax=Ornithodoros turicata TaxID=34597 RepID=UPI0031386B71